ncbi:hypothetical protein HOY82DRAFT_329193 [Tuber indicum]|nr:hypothetical protein HOY82DRAFT_329193 [Tuber indicum]
MVIWFDLAMNNNLYFVPILSISGERFGIYIFCIACIFFYLFFDYYIPVETVITRTMLSYHINRLVMHTISIFTFLLPSFFLSGSLVGESSCVLS